jgi:hypothetical protein
MAFILVILSSILVLDCIDARTGSDNCNLNPESGDVEVAEAGGEVLAQTGGLPGCVRANNAWRSKRTTP